MRCLNVIRIKNQVEIQIRTEFQLDLLYSIISVLYVSIPISHLTVFGGILKLRLSLTSLARDFLICLNALSVLRPTNFMSYILSWIHTY